MGPQTCIVIQIQHEPIDNVGVHGGDPLLTV